MILHPIEVPYIVTGSHGNFPQCTLGTSPRKQTEMRFSSQPQFHHTPVKHKADQSHLAPEQLADTRNSGNPN